MDSWHDLFVAIDRELYASIDRTCLRILYLLHSSQEEYCSYKTLSIASAMTHDQLSKALQSLLAKGLITKDVDTTDKRVTLYRLEEKGQQLIQASDALIANEIFEFFRQNIRTKSNQFLQESFEARNLITK